MNTPSQRLKFHLESSISQCEAVIAKFKEKLDKDPFYAFEWGTEAIYAAAKLKVYRSYLAFFDGRANEDDTLYETIVNDAKQRVLEMARYPESSSSQLDNVSKRALLATYATIADR